MDRTSLAAEIVRVSELHGSFRLRSGAVAERYFDKYQFESDPHLLGQIADALASLVPRGIDALAGLELGGVPIATRLSQVTGIPTRFVRKEAKAYGTARLAEGGDIDGQTLCIVEDVVTSGGQISLSASALRERGARVEVALCVIDREAGGAEALARDGIALRPLFCASELDAAGTFPN